MNARQRNRTDAISRRPQAPTGKLAPIKRFHARHDSSDSDDHRNDMDDEEGDSDLDRTLVQQASSPGPSKVVSLEDAAADRALIDEMRSTMLLSHGVVKNTTRAALVAAATDLSNFLNNTCVDICAKFTDTFEAHATKNSEIGDVEKQDLNVMMKRLEAAKVKLNEKAHAYGKAEAKYKARAGQFFEEIKGQRARNDEKWQILAQDWADISKEQMGKIDAAASDKGMKTAQTKQIAAMLADR